MRRLQTFAVTWIQPSTKFRTRIDRVGPSTKFAVTWIDKFLIRVSPEKPPPSPLRYSPSASSKILFSAPSSSSSAVSSLAEASSPPPPPPPYHWRRLHRLLTSGSPGSEPLRSARFRSGAPPAGFKEFSTSRPWWLTFPTSVPSPVLPRLDTTNCWGKKSRNRRKHRQKCMSEGKLEAGEDSSVDDSCSGDFTEMSDGGESTTSTSSAASAAASPRILREMNGQELNQDDCGWDHVLARSTKEDTHQS